MCNHRNPYTWSRRDRVLYVFTLIPFGLAFLGTLYLLGTISLVLPFIVAGLYMLANVFQAGCCVGCPYRGRFCPAIFGVYLANFLSVRLYPKRQFNPRFFEINAALAEGCLLAILVLSAICLWGLHWGYVGGLVILIATHVFLTLWLFCPKCSYRDTCPAGKMACRLFNISS
ncbi:MAG: hypothetical protein MUO62_07455 [Anaerolineales bacterium]|nr:hypothetical protein [Anaerolineales bacterium]